MRAGRWVQFHDALHYVTGIARSPDDEPIVSWSMSHMGANTLIRVHNADATPRTSFSELESKYFQRVAYSLFDKTLYGLEGDAVVSIVEGKPTILAKQGVRVFDRSYAVVDGCLCKTAGFEGAWVCWIDRGDFQVGY